MNYRNIKSERQFKDATGYGKSSFSQLLSDYEATYFEQKGQTYEAYVEENVTEPPRLSSLGDALFFILFQLKNGLIWGALGVVFEMSGTTAHDNFVKFSELLEQTLEKKMQCRREDLKALKNLKSMSRMPKN